MHTLLEASCCCCCWWSVLLRGLSVDLCVEQATLWSSLLTSAASGCRWSAATSWGWTHQTPTHHQLPLVEPTTRRSSVGDRAFLVAAARAWNSLPSTVTAASTMHPYRRAPKLVDSPHLSHHLSYISELTYHGFGYVRWPCSLLTLRHANLFYFYITLHYCAHIGVCIQPNNLVDWVVHSSDGLLTMLRLFVCVLTSRCS